MKGDRKALETLLIPVCDNGESVRAVLAAQLSWGYECSVGPVPETSPASIIQHSTLRSLWHVKFPTVDEVPVGHFLAALVNFLSTVLLMPAEDVDSMLNGEQRKALEKQLSHAYPVNNQVCSQLPSCITGCELCFSFPGLRDQTARGCPSRC